MTSPSTRYTFFYLTHFSSTNYLVRMHWVNHEILPYDMYFELFGILWLLILSTSDNRCSQSNFFLIVRCQWQSAKQQIKAQKKVKRHTLIYKLTRSSLSSWGVLNRLQSIFEAIEIPVFQLYCVLIPLLKSYIWWHVIDSGKHSQKENNK